MRTEGRAIVPALNALGVEAMTPGNWEYGFGPDVLRRRINEMDFPVLACNLQNADSGEHWLPPYAMREVDGLRVGLVGITSPIIPQMSPAFARGLRFPDVRAHLPHCIDKLEREEHADLIVAISHLGFAQDVALAGEVGGIDVILSGHTHNRLTAPVRAGRTLIIQSGFSGSFLGRLDVELCDGVIINTRHELIALGAQIAPDPAMQALVDEQLAPFRAEMEEVVGSTRCGLHRMALAETSMDNLITDAYLHETGADVALSHGWRFAPPVAPGNITMGDLWAMVPTNPELALVPLTGAQLADLLEENLHHVLAPNPFQQAGGYFFRVSGLSAVVRPYNARGMRIEQLSIAGAPMEADRAYTVAEGGIRQLRTYTGRTPAGMRSHDALRRYLAAQSPVNPEITHRKFILQ